MIIPKPIVTKFTQDFNVDYPIISAPMFLVSNSEMVKATAKAGGLGAFPALNYRPIENFRTTVKEIKQAQGPFAINIIVQSSNQLWKEQTEICLEEEVDLIITSLGNPKEVLQLCKGTKTKVYSDVANYKHARKVIDLGVHGLIAVGHGAGGHAGTISPFALVPYLRQYTQLPIVAAGAIVNGAGMAAAFSLGADAIYMGTRFIASREAQVQSAYKQAIISAMCEDIVNTDRVDGFPGNFILTESLKKLGLRPSLLEKILSHSTKIKRFIGLMRAKKTIFSLPQKKNKASYKTIFSAGHGVGLINDEKSIEEIIHQTAQEYHQIKGMLP